MRGIRIAPRDGIRVLVVAADVAHEFASEVGHGREDAAGNGVALDLGEPQFDLVQPRGVGRGEVQVEPGVIREKPLDEELLGTFTVREFA